uniref:Thioredoxin domain-containing protein n=1 Tax=Pseudo-nitzschia delicatissima TaxID=44447 RepID=A0A7S0YB03_9STRA|mmetsp:Transcript_15/g.37  ORF Transcript_15/g.37 Transcript_15/m.37 type:complete len:212 (+) Transcript_15:133-768(+)|eukprot:CAMPEP_0197270142 /NCGR_PEP_ID=MMETSP1432-20130617/6727_1 /TAXON_ID=44447 /ORGANISM="Pseudo-nitzschia delicatissima, Strain UNC1205" /LENGTH=211 /DNA_ID=CAMNT_0042735405 /DNA_START=74 /DNA_END=709 /DNA_ORIENTATION=+
MNMFTNSALLCLLFSTCLFWLVESRGNPLSKIKVPFVSKLKKKEYSPLVFFTFPKGYVEECDEMDRIVSEVEQELGVRVERLDIARDPAAQATMQLLTSQQGPPFLYHRESCQIVTGTPQPKTNSRNAAPEAKPAGIDKSRVRAWAKGRYLPPVGVKLGATSKKSSNAPIVISQEDNAVDQAELIKESSLTPEQLEGKRAMEERTAKATAN